MREVRAVPAGGPRPRVSLASDGSSRFDWSS